MTRFDVAETGVDVALDSSPTRYITGSAYSNDLPTTDSLSMTPSSSTLGANSPPSQNPNVFVAKFDTTMLNQNSLVYATYIGAKGNTKPARGAGDGDLGFGIAVDGDGDAYIVGQTYSGNMGLHRRIFRAPICAERGARPRITARRGDQGFVSD